MYFFYFFSQAIQIFFKINDIQNYISSTQYYTYYSLKMGVVCCSQSQSNKKQQSPTLSKQKRHQPTNLCQQIKTHIQIDKKHQPCSKQVKQKSINTSIIPNQDQEKLRIQKVEQQKFKIQQQKQRALKQNESLRNQMKQYQNKFRQAIQQHNKKMEEAAARIKKQEQQRRIVSKSLHQKEKYIQQFRKQKEGKQQSFKNQILVKQKQLQQFKMQLNIKEEEYLKNINLLQIETKLYEEKICLKQQALEEIKFNQLFQNDIFISQQQHKKYLIKTLQDVYRHKIIKTKFLFKFDVNNNINFHRTIDNLPNIVIVVKLANNQFVAAFSEGAFSPKMVSNKDAIILSLTNKKTFFLCQANKRAISYDDYYIIFGNSEFRLRSQQRMIFSNFGITTGYFQTRGESVNVLLGSNAQRQVGIDFYEIYQILFAAD